MRGVPHHAADLAYLFDNVPFSACAPSPPSDSELYYDEDPLEHLQDVEELKLKLEAETLYDDDDNDDLVVTRRDMEDEWSPLPVDEWSYNCVRNAIQERWICFANGEAPWNEDKIFVFGAEGETGERSADIFEGRRRRQTWHDVFEPLGMQLVHKVGLELCNGPQRY